MAIVGSGPSGFYAAEAILDAHDGACVHLYDRLATPWGLVRTGVAPDHPKIKSASAQYEKTAARPGFRFFGHVELGTHISREDLLARYDAVVYAVGAQTERRLGIPGEDLTGSIASVDFVGWYNGHPDHAHLAPPLDRGRAVVIGAGNVALDVARMLVLPHHVLSGTDVADHALDALAASAVDDVTIHARRGPVQAAFTTTELRELDALDDLTLDVRRDEIPGPETPELVDRSKATRRNVDLLRSWSEGARDADRGKRLAFRFHRSPVAIRGDGRVEEVEFAVNRLEVDEGGAARAVDTGERETVAAGLVLRAVGYRGVALTGVPFDDARGTVPHDRGRVVGGEREYVVGWIKRGPTGIIGTNRKDAVETVRTLLEDIDRGDVAGADPPSTSEIEKWVDDRSPDLIDLAGWGAIDAHERAAGHGDGRPRVKVVDRSTHVALSRGERVPPGGPAGP